jgi:hypothetical protein
MKMKPDDIILDPFDLKDIDKLLSLMKTISKHKIDYKENYNNMPIKNKFQGFKDMSLALKEIKNFTGLQLSLSRIFKFITYYKIDNERTNKVSQHLVLDIHELIIDLSIKIKELKKAHEYWLNNKSNGKR